MMGTLDQRLMKLEQAHRQRLLQRLRDAREPLESVAAAGALVDAFPADADPRMIARVIASATGDDPDELLAEAERLTDHPEEFEALKLSLGVTDG